MTDTTWTPGLVHRPVEEQAARAPGTVAVTMAGTTAGTTAGPPATAAGTGGPPGLELTYGELERRANGLATALRELGVGPDRRVAVMLDRSPGLVVALLAVLKAGGAYVPIDVEAPRARVEQILERSQAVAMFSAPRLGDFGVPRAPLEAAPADRPPEVDVRPGHLCAVYYTSGTTGEPKGVACTHEGWSIRMAWMQRSHGLRAGEAVLHKTTLTFDDSAVEVFWPLSAGGRVALLGPGEHRDPRAIIEGAVAGGAVHLQFVPSMLEQFLDTLTPADVARLASVRTVLSSGEALRPELVRRFRDAFGHAVLLENTWGATEASIDSTRHVCVEEDGLAERGAVCLGRPIDGNSVHVLDGDLTPVPAGEPGQLAIAGPSLARCYLGDPRRTAAAFVPHLTRPGQRVYLTGDRGVELPDGSFSYLDRLDRQVKIRGMRLELEEVETALRRHEAVGDAAVTVWEPEPGDRRLAAYVVLGQEATPDGLRAFLGGLLPAYAVPNAVVTLDALPRLPNGKLDRRGLPEPLPGPSAGYTAPGSVTERVVADIWQDVLGLPRVGAHDDFFAVGGHSLLATRVVNRMRHAFDTHIPLSLLFEHPTVAALAEQVERLVAMEIAAMDDDEVLSLGEGGPHVR